ncbi:MAG: hypothetical protein HYR83_12700 [Planctomycetes bacterium]|nr:hypothetical protein [Planctomycetota bacterium]
MADEDRLPVCKVIADSNCTDGIENECNGYMDLATKPVACPTERIPAMSEWGMVFVTLLTLTSSTLLCLRRGNAAGGES